MNTSVMILDPVRAWQGFFLANLLHLTKQQKPCLLQLKPYQKRRVSVSLKVCDTLGGTNHWGCITSFTFIVIQNCYLSHIFSFLQMDHKKVPAASGSEV